MDCSISRVSPKDTRLWLVHVKKCVCFCVHVCVYCLLFLRRAFISAGPHTIYVWWKALLSVRRWGHMLIHEGLLNRSLCRRPASNAASSCMDKREWTSCWCWMLCRIPFHKHPSQDWLLSKILYYSKSITIWLFKLFHRFTYSLTNTRCQCPFYRLSDELGASAGVFP